eukprot:97968-Amphidinium_carterae.2
MSKQTGGESRLSASISNRLLMQTEQAPWMGRGEDLVQTTCCCNCCSHGACKRHSNADAKSEIGFCGCERIAAAQGEAEAKSIQTKRSNRKHPHHTVIHTYGSNLKPPLLKKTPLQFIPGEEVEATRGERNQQRNSEQLLC